MLQTKEALRDEPPRYPGTPRWVKAFGMVLSILVLLVVILLFAGGGRHGPSRHLPSADAGGDTSTSRVVE